MPIDFEFSDESLNLCGFSKKSIESISYRILDYFSDLKDYSSILYFTHEPRSYKNWRKPWAKFFPLRCPYSNLKNQHPGLYQKIQNRANTELLFYFTRIITEGDETKKTNFMAHEFQHAIQYLKYKKIYYYSMIIEYFLVTIKNVMDIKKLPHEYDALRQSKIVAISLCGKKSIDKFIIQMSNDPEFTDEISLWNLINLLNVKKDYDLEDEVINLWKNYNFEQKIDALKKQKNVSCYERILIEMYNLANLNA